MGQSTRQRKELLLSTGIYRTLARVESFLLRDRLGLDEPQRALDALERERLSPLIRGMALVSLLADLIEHKGLVFHTGVLELLDRQAGETAIPALECSVFVKGRWD